MNTKTKTSLLMACGLAFAALPSAFAGDMDDKFKMMDSDGDGRVSRAEQASGAQAMFSAMDANSDGMVTATECDAAKAAHESKVSKLKFWDKDDKMTGAEKIAMIDTNSDGQLSRAEHEAGSAAMFTKMDTDNDGYLSEKECKAGHKLMKKDK